MAIEKSKLLVVLGTGGTIAGQAVTASDNVGYRAGQVGVAQLVESVPAIASYAERLVSEQVAQVDSKDMDFAVWQRLLARCLHHLRKPEVRALVVTHGTDTMEETAFFLHLALGRAGLLHKPVVLTGAMRPASSSSPDGPQNLADALVVADDLGSAGVMVAFAGLVHPAAQVQKQYTYRVNAFGSGEAGPLGVVEEGRVRWLGAVSCMAPAAGAEAFQSAGSLHVDHLLAHMAAQPWPRVDIALSYAGVSGASIDALLDGHGAEKGPDILRGLVIAGTGNGTVHQALEAAVRRAAAKGVVVWRASRCPWGAVVRGPTAEDLPDAGSLSPVKARIALLLQLMEQDMGPLPQQAVGQAVD